MSDTGNTSTHEKLKKALSGNFKDETNSPPAPLLRKEKTKTRELQKKMGGGKKGLWGKPEDLITVPAVDQGDPSFDSEGEDNVVLVTSNASSPPQTGYRSSDFDFGPSPKYNLPEVKKHISRIIAEYFVSGDSDEVLRSIKELESCVFHYEIVKRAITMSMDKQEKEREMVSRLLSELYPTILKTREVGKGFERALELADDLELDIPNARPILATFLARAVVDEILPPSFLMDPLVMRLGGDIVDQAKKKLSINHGTARLERGWGPGDGRPVEELKVAIDQLMQEFMSSGDHAEAARCVRELNVPHFHHEVIKRAISNALDKDEQHCSLTSSLLKYLVHQQVISKDQARRGFDRIQQGMDDLKLDVPNVHAIVSAFIDQAKADGILS